MKNRASPIAPFAGLLLAGGRSRRMGRDKAQLAWRGRPLGEHQAAILAATGASPLYLSCRADQLWTPPVFTRLEDRAVDGGTLDACVDALATIDADVTLVLAIDLPLVEPEWLAGLARRAAQEKLSIVPLAHGHFEPLAAAWHRTALPTLRTTLTSNESLRSACGALRHEGLLRPERVDAEHAARLANLNTPDDAARLGCSA